MLLFQLNYLILNLNIVHTANFNKLLFFSIFYIKKIFQDIITLCHIKIFHKCINFIVSISLHNQSLFFLKDHLTLLIPPQLQGLIFLSKHHFIILVNLTKIINKNSSQYQDMDNVAYHLKNHTVTSLISKIVNYSSK